MGTHSSFVRAAAAAAVAAAGALALPPAAHACCPAHPPGAQVQIADQEVIIVWDAARNTEHFIRRAAFATEQASFGFLVPTPSVPSLGEAPDAAFGVLARAIEPEVKHVPRYSFGSILFTTLSATKHIDEVASRGASAGCYPAHSPRVLTPA